MVGYGFGLLGNGQSIMFFMSISLCCFSVRRVWYVSGFARQSQGCELAVGRV